VIDPTAREITGSILERQGFNIEPSYTQDFGANIVAFKTAQNNTVRASKTTRDGVMDVRIGVPLI
jgi:hypothetical protein